MRNYILKNPILEQEFGDPAGAAVQDTDPDTPTPAVVKDTKAQKAQAAAAAARAEKIADAKKRAEDARREIEKLKKDKERRDAEALAKARGAAARASNRTKKKLKEIREETDPNDDATPWWLWAGGVIGGLWAGNKYLNYRKLKKLTRAVTGVADAQSQLVKVVEPVVKATEEIADATKRSADAAETAAGLRPAPDFRPILGPDGKVVSQVKVELVKGASDDVYRAAAEALPEPAEATKMRQSAQRAADVIEKLKIK